MNAKKGRGENRPFLFFAAYDIITEQAKMCAGGGGQDGCSAEAEYDEI